MISAAKFLRAFVSLTDSESSSLTAYSLQWFNIQVITIGTQNMETAFDVVE